MHYGDHHPMATRTCGFKTNRKPSGVPSIRLTALYLLFRAGHQLPFPALPSHDSPRVAYLGTVSRLAGCPVGLHRERKRLMTCPGALLQLQTA